MLHVWVSKEEGVRNGVKSSGVRVIGPCKLSDEGTEN